MIEQYKNQWFSVIKDGKFHYIREFGSDNGAIVLIESDSGYVFVRVSRAAHSFKEQIEAPRGYGEVHESSIETAIRESFEEAGCSIKREQIEKIGTIKPNSAILASSVDVFYARIGDNQISDSQDTEVHGVVTIARDDIQYQIASGLVTDSFTLSAFALLWSKYP